MPVDSVTITDRALRAVGLTRAQGLHFFGHFMGIAGDLPANGRAVLRLQGEPPGIGASAISDVALATLADLAMGSAVRSWVEAGARLGTVTISVQHTGEPVVGPLEAIATSLPVQNDCGLSQCQVIDMTSGRTVGLAQGWFAVLPVPPGVRLGLMPWERVPQPTGEPATLADLDEREQAALAAAEAAGRRAAATGTTVSQELLAYEWHPAGKGEAHGTLPLGPQLGNRVGNVQGGALYGAAALAAAQAVATSTAVLTDGHYQFLRPGDGSALTARARVVRHGRTVAFVEATLASGDVLVGHGEFTFRL
jgi:acyl-coenzyme A thioesterase PaaI-like protein